MSFTQGPPEFKRAYDELMDLPSGFTMEDLPLTAEIYGDEWTEHERFILIYLAVQALHVHYERYFLGLNVYRLVKWFKVLSDIGRRWRPENPWPSEIRDAFETLVFYRGPEFCKPSIKANLPFEAMTASSVLLMSLCDPSSLKTIEFRLTQRLPLRLTDGDASDLAMAFSSYMPPVAVIKTVMRLLDDGSTALLMKKLAAELIKGSAMSLLDGGSISGTPWNKLSGAHIAFIAELLPDNDKAGCFCRLCMGTKQYFLSSDPEKVSAFLAAGADDDLLTAHLSLFLMAWVDADPDLILRLFEDSLAIHREKGWWPQIVNLVESVSNRENTVKIADGLSRVMRKKIKTGKKPDEKETIRLLDILKKRGAIPESEERFSEREPDWSDIKKAASKIFAEMDDSPLSPEEIIDRLFRENEKRSGSGNKRNTRGKNRKERLGKPLFPNEEDDDADSEDEFF
jgi:hypothetical protein